MKLKLFREIEDNPWVAFRKYVKAVLPPEAQYHHRSKDSQASGPKRGSRAPRRERLSALRHKAAA